MEWKDKRAGRLGKIEKLVKKTEWKLNLTGIGRADIRIVDLLALIDIHCIV